MNLNKLGLVVASAGAIFMATSCNKNNTLSLKAATKWVEEHYTKSGTETLKSGKYIHDYSKTTGKDLRKSIQTQYGLEDNLKGESEMTQEELAEYSTNLAYLNGNLFKLTYPDEEAVKEMHAKFTVSGKSFVVTISNTEGKAKMAFITKYDADGFPVSTSMKVSGQKVEGVDGTVNGISTAEVTY